MTPLQSAVTFATIANGGVRIQPSIVADYTQADGTIVRPNAPQRTEVVSAETAATLTQMMREVVSDRGTAPLAKIPGYQVAGKTGTAQFVDPTCGCYNGVMSAFDGFAPADNPALVIGVSVVRPKYSIYGIAPSVFRQVMAYALQVRQIPPTSTSSTSTTAGR
jgi:cell division protein FtsI (penicillin-binding protein 3)